MRLLVSGSAKDDYQMIFMFRGAPSWSFSLGSMSASRFDHSCYVSSSCLDADLYKTRSEASGVMGSVSRYWSMAQQEEKAADYAL